MLSHSQRALRRHCTAVDRFRPHQVKYSRSSGVSGSAAVLDAGARGGGMRRQALAWMSAAGGRQPLRGWRRAGCSPSAQAHAALDHPARCPLLPLPVRPLGQPGSAARSQPCPWMAPQPARLAPAPRPVRAKGRPFMHAITLSRTGAEGSAERREGSSPRSALKTEVWIGQAIREQLSTS